MKALGVPVCDLHYFALLHLLPWTRAGMKTFRLNVPVCVFDFFELLLVRGASRYEVVTHKNGGNKQVRVKSKLPLNKKVLHHLPPEEKNS